MTTTSTQLVHMLTADIRAANRRGITAPAAVSDYLVTHGWRPEAADVRAESTEHLARAGGASFESAAELTSEAVAVFVLGPPAVDDHVTGEAS